MKMFKYKTPEEIKSGIKKVRQAQVNPSSDYMNGYMAALNAIEEALSLIPNTDNTIEHHGVWIERFITFEDSFTGLITEPVHYAWVCSCCGREEYRKEPYCHCGALMDNY